MRQPRCRNRTSGMSMPRQRFLPQGYPAFRSPYAGANSLPGGRTTPGNLDHDGPFSAFRLWQGAEFYFDPELAQGFAINGTLGLAGFPNGEAQKGGNAFPKIRPQRYYIKQTFRSRRRAGRRRRRPPINWQARRDIDRVTLVVGRFAIGDFFDNNAYAHDPRARLHELGLVGISRLRFPRRPAGLYARRTGSSSIARTGRCAPPPWSRSPSAPNSDVLNFKTGGRCRRIRGASTRCSINPASCGWALFGNQGNTGNYRDALAIVAADPTLDVNAVMRSIQHTNPKYGFLRQPRTTDRQGRRPLRSRRAGTTATNQILSFTDIDRSLFGWRPPSRAAIGDARTTPSASAAPSTGLSAAPSRLPRRRRHRLVDRRWSAQLPPRADSRGLLRLFAEQECHPQPPTISSS